MDIFDDLYDSEINFSISSFWDAGYIVKLGDVDNGFVEDGEANTMQEAAEFLRDAAIRHYPETEFAKKYAS